MTQLVIRFIVSQSYEKKATFSLAVTISNESVAYFYSSSGWHLVYHTNLCIVHESLWTNCPVTFSATLMMAHFPISTSVRQLPLLNHYGNPSPVTIVISKSFSPAQDRYWLPQCPQTLSSGEPGPRHFWRVLRGGSAPPAQSSAPTPDQKRNAMT